MALKDMIGERVGKLLVVERANNNEYGVAKWKCVCDCGETRIVEGTGLRAGRNKSCGCASPRFRSKYFVMPQRTRTYKIWLGMRARCSASSKGKIRKLYYDKGIRVCDDWQSYGNFYRDMGDAPDNLSIDRIDGNKGYEPSNCRWATMVEQANNTSANHLITFNGQTKTLSIWAKEIGIKANTILCRIRNGNSIERAFQKEMKSMNTIRKSVRSTKCLICSNDFIPRNEQIKNGSGKFCSRKCYGVSKTASTDRKEHG